MLGGSPTSLSILLHLMLLSAASCCLPPCWFDVFGWSTDPPPLPGRAGHIVQVGALGGGMGAGSPLGPS